MSYDTHSLGVWIERTFRVLSCVPTEHRGWAVLGEDRTKPHHAERRELNRKRRQLSDPEYAERRRAQARASYHRNKHKHRAK